MTESDAIPRHAEDRLPELIDWIGGLVRIESPTDDKAAVDRAVEYVADRVAPFAKVKLRRQRRYGNHLRVEFNLPGRRKTSQVLGLGHLDTVWPIGTIERMPFKQAEGRLWGPGVFDMKSGVAFFVFAAEALRELDIPVPHRFVVQLNSDEEIGSPSSRPFTEAEAKKSKAVLVPGHGAWHCNAVANCCMERRRKSMPSIAPAEIASIKSSMACRGNTRKSTNCTFPNESAFLQTFRNASCTTSSASWPLPSTLYARE